MVMIGRPFFLLAASLSWLCFQSSLSINHNGDDHDQGTNPNPYATLNDAASSYSRRIASTAARPTQPKKDMLRQGRLNYPETEPQICLAFLSCCGRTDLLNHTIAGAIRHMEEDEPDFLRYEIAWVDNGSGVDKTESIKDTYQIEHALTLKDNHGLAYGMNLLIFDLCKAPYILLLEEDWLYLDELITKQTPQRKRIISTSVALLETLKSEGRAAYDGRNIMGVFLRQETYESFLQFPFADIWEEQAVDLARALPSSQADDEECSNSDGATATTTVDYRVFCGDTSLRSDNIWGSYTNGAGLYRRQDLHKIGRMYGEPGDIFHDRYVEGNYAYRAALRNCHAAVRVSDDKSCNRVDSQDCVGGFHHIGGGRGTRPMTAEGTQCEGPTWNFFGTPLFDKYHKLSKSLGHPIALCSEKELKELKEKKFRDMDSKEYREAVARDNKAVFEREREERQKMKLQSRRILQMVQTNSDHLRSQIAWMADMSDQEIMDAAIRMDKLADSAHPIPGFWDSHGRIIPA